MKSNKINYLVVGVFVIAMGGGLFAAFLALAGRSGGPVDVYYTYFDDVTDIKYGTKVLYMGFPVGQVEAVEPVADPSGALERFRIALAVEKRERRAWWSRLTDWERGTVAPSDAWNIPEDSEAKIKTSGLLAAVSIDIRTGDSATFLSPGDTIHGRERVDMLTAMTDTANTIKELAETDIRNMVRRLTSNVNDFTALLEAEGGPLIRNLNAVAAEFATHRDVFENFKTVSQQIGSAAERLRAVLDEENTGRIRETLRHTEALSGDLAAMTEDGTLRQTLENVRAASHNVAELSAHARGRLDDVLSETTVKKVQAAIDNVGSAAQDIAQLTRDLRSTRDKLEHFIDVLDTIATENRSDINDSVKDLRHTMESISRNIGSITYNLEGTTRNMYEFSRQLRQNPGLLLGGTPPSDAASGL